MNRNIINSSFVYSILALGSVFALTSCHSSSVSQVADQSDQSDSENKPVLREVERQLATVESKVISDQIVSSGVVSARSEQSYKIVAGTTGKVVEVRGQVGERVSKGQTVALFDRRNLREQLEQSAVSLQDARSTVNRANDALNAARDSFQRQQQQIQADVNARVDVQTQQTQLKAAEAQLATAQAQLRAAQSDSEKVQSRAGVSQLPSPVNGVIVQRFLNAGAMVDAATPIMQIAAMNDVDVSVLLPSDTGKLVLPGEQATITSATNPDTKCNGEVKKTVAVTDSGSNSVKVQLSVHNPNLMLRDGQQVTVLIAGKNKRTVIEVPRKAIVPNPDDPDSSMVYVVTAGKAKRESVTVGPIKGDNIEIVDGLRGGEIIVASGAYGLPDDTPIKLKSSN